MKKILFTGGSGRFGKVFRQFKHKFKIDYPTKKNFDIEKLDSVMNYLSKSKPKYLIHCAALSRPMSIHETNITKSISTNIIGTANIVKACAKFKIKLIYFSTNYVYPGKKGNYSENDALLPINNYAISKLGGECSVQLYKNSLILRICMTEKPFPHKKAFGDVEMNFMFHEDFAKYLLKLIDKKGIINVGGPTKIVYDFAKQSNKNVSSMSAKKKFGKNYPLKQSMNLKKLKKIIKKI